jgi:hypothetical protein
MALLSSRPLAALTPRGRGSPRCVERPARLSNATTSQEIFSRLAATSSSSRETIASSPSARLSGVICVDTFAHAPGPTRARTDRATCRAVVSARLGDAKVGEERNALRLGEERVKLSSIISTKIERTQRPEPRVH